MYSCYPQHVWSEYGSRLIILFTTWRPYRSSWIILTHTRSHSDSPALLRYPALLPGHKQKLGHETEVENPPRNLHDQLWFIPAKLLSCAETGSGRPISCFHDVGSRETNETPSGIRPGEAARCRGRLCKQLAPDLRGLTDDFIHHPGVVVLYLTICNVNRPWTESLRACPTPTCYTEYF
jgi:hypothetical protein